ncbi:MAG: hypothetical protein QMD36_01665 [Candidatus Aenigmarchaeota archaeon]|nr:hypothetical protein [Candidatus Aenigmarchaeota archaeon]
MLFGEERDWKELMEEKSKIELAELIEKAKKHRAAYLQADDVKVAQLWVALTEVSKQLKDTGSKLERLENIAKGFVEMAEIVKKETLRERVSDVFKPKTSKEREAVDKIVDSLMEF